MEWIKDLWDSLLDADHRGRLSLIGGIIVTLVGWAIYWHKSKNATARDDASTVLQRDWNIRDALEWWEESTGLNRGDVQSLDFFRDLRQAACDGNIIIWGRANSEHRTPSEYTEPLRQIPAEHWTHVENKLDVMRYVYAENEDMIRDAATPPGRDSTPVGTRYVDLRLASTEVKEYVSPLIERKMSMFDRLWKFLSEEKNLEILSFIGTGIVVLIGSLWAIYVHFSEASPSPKQHIEATDGSIAAGGNITAGRDINIGITLEEHEASLKRKEEEVREEYSVSPLGSEKRTLLEKELAALEQNRLHLEKSLQATQKVYANTIKLFNEKLSTKLPPDRIEQANKAIAEGDPGMAVSLLEQVATSGIQQSAEASYQLGLLAKDHVDYEKAWQALARATELAPDNSLYLNETGLMADTLGRYDTAIEYFGKALAIDLRNNGPGHSDVARDWNNLGNVWRAKGNYDKAIEYLEKSLASNLKTVGPEHPKVAIVWNNLGLSWQAKGETDKAIKYYQKALASDLKTYGPNHFKVAAYWNNLGTANYAKGQYDKAIEYFEKALDNNLQTVGPEHPDVARDWNNLGGAWKAKGNYDKARESFEMALAIVKKAGLEHRVQLVEGNIRSLPPAP